ncbi:hypothetical protein [Pararhodobacter aggregans]|uniref:hypothetical protein n=1 Tax=Pararhodobacter aggregans TaxID=404875 RepID=UPI00105784B0|nr:hypothetical protein [Pararhodobacter aggregans]
MTQNDPEPLQIKHLNRVDLCSLSLRYAFSDLIYRFNEREKFETRKVLDKQKKLMAARKLRQAVNRTLIHHQEGILRTYNRDTRPDDAALAQAMIVTIPAIWRTARFFYRNALPIQSVGNLSEITNISRQIISNKLSLFRKDHDGYIKIGKVSGIMMEMVDIPGREQKGHKMVLLEPANIAGHLPNAIVIYGPDPSIGKQIEGEEITEELARARLFKEIGRPILELQGESKNLIEIIKFLDDKIFASRYFVEGNKARLIHGDEPLAFRTLSIHAGSWRRSSVG